MKRFPSWWILKHGLHVCGVLPGCPLAHLLHVWHTQHTGWCLHRGGRAGLTCLLPGTSTLETWMCSAVLSTFSQDEGVTSDKQEVKLALLEGSLHIRAVAPDDGSFHGGPQVLGL